MWRTAQHRTSCSHGTPRPDGPPKEGPQSKGCVLVNCGSSLSLRAICIAAANRLRQSCCRDRGPVAHPRDRHPVRRSRHAAAFTTIPPPPPRNDSAAMSADCASLPPTMPTASPCHNWKFNTCCLLYASAPVRAGDEGVRWRAPRSLPPLESFAPQGADSELFARRAARARGSACKKKAGGVAPKTPFIARAIPAAAGTRSTACPLSFNVCRACKPSFKAAGSQSPAVRALPATLRVAMRCGRVAPIGRVGCAGWLTLGSSRLPLRGSGSSRKVFIISVVPGGAGHDSHILRISSDPPSPSHVRFSGARVAGRIQHKRPMVTRSLGPQSGFELLADSVPETFRGQHLYVRHPREYPADYLFAAGGFETHLDAAVPPHMALL